MSQLPFHPAPGFGDLAPGWSVVPQNPIHSDGTDLVPSIQATAPGHVIQIRRLGDLVAASFVVPQNPIVDALKNSMAKAGMSGCGGLGCGCAGFGCDGGAEFYSLNGLGQLDTSSLSNFISSVPTWAQEPSMIASIPNWAFYGGLAVGAYMIFMPGGKEYRGKARALRSQYRGYRRFGQTLAAQNPRRRNESISEGYYNRTGFHPIRSADDYDPEAVGESRAYATRKRRTARRAA